MPKKSRDDLKEMMSEYEKNNAQTRLFGDEGHTPPFQPTGYPTPYPTYHRITHPPTFARGSKYEGEVLGGAIAFFVCAFGSSIAVAMSCGYISNMCERRRNRIAAEQLDQVADGGDVALNELSSGEVSTVILSHSGSAVELPLIEQDNGQDNGRH